jgi:carboxyl-terminal processing protease
MDHMKLTISRLVVFLLVTIFIFSCKKNDSVSPNALFNADGTPKRKVTGDIKDSVYFYAETFYLWYKNLPKATEFKPESFSEPEAVINAVKTYSEKGADGKNRDKWSFVMDMADWNAIASGNSKDFGVYYRFAADGNLYVRQVFAKSSAGLQGVERGWKVLSLAGLTPKNDEVFINQFTKALENNNLEIQFELPSGIKKNIILSETSYNTNTIQAANVFSENGKNIGYFCLTDFLGNDTAAGLESLFSDFRAKNVTELVIDLRYNGGGYVTLAQQLCNLIAPSAANGKVMFIYQYNDKLKAYNKSTNFKTTNKLNISKLVVITSKNSASASELLINSLKPHMDVKIVGTASNGKPVGFPVIPVLNYVVAPVAFKTVNSLGEADYYEGFKPDFPEVDDLTKNFGNPEEKCLKVALEYLKTGKVITNVARNARVASFEDYQIWNNMLPNGFEGLADTDLNNQLEIKKLISQLK